VSENRTHMLGQGAYFLYPSRSLGQSPDAFFKHEGCPFDPNIIRDVVAERKVDARKGNHSNANKETRPKESMSVLQRGQRKRR